MAKFKCPKCNKEILVSKFRTYFRKGKQQNINLENNQEILCPTCGACYGICYQKKEILNLHYSSFSGTFSS